MSLPIKISIRNVYKIFGRDMQQALALVKSGTTKKEILATTGNVVGINNVSLDIEAAKTFVIMGLSGSGKSTLIRHINRLIEPTDGQILFEGQDVLRFNQQELQQFRRHKISMVFQNFGLLPHKTVVDNVAYPLLISGTNRTKARETAMVQIELVGLVGFEQKYPHQLSGGMRQRVGLARALATDADVLLMDEAFSALDPLIRNDMQQQLKELQARLHKTIVFITHDLDEALLLGDQIAILKDGELRQCGTRKDILLNPADDYVKRFVRDVNRARVVTIGSVAEPCSVLLGKKPSYAQLRDALKMCSAAVLWRDPKNNLLNAITARQFELGQALQQIAICDLNMVLDEVLPLLSGNQDCVALADEKGAVKGVLTRSGLMRAMTREKSTTDDSSGA